MDLKYEELEDKLSSKLRLMFPVIESFVEVNPGKVIMPSYNRDHAQRILDLQIRPDDVWLVAHPRTGSTWMLEMLWCITNHLDFHKALTTFQLVRSPLLEMSTILSNKGLGKVVKVTMVNGEDSINEVEEMDSPRCIRTHLPYHLLPQQINTVKPKVVYICRNPKDICVSYYKFLKWWYNLQNCSFEEFAEIFMEGKVPLYGSYMDHVLGFWKLRNEPNVFFIKYEEMRKNFTPAVEKLSKFLGKDFSEEEIDSLLDHASFQKMQSNPAVNGEHVVRILDMDESQDNKHIRKGQVGDWRNHMTEEMSAKFDNWMIERLMGTGLSFESN